MSQSVLGKYACGFPQLLVLMVLEPLSTSLGILVAVRGQNLFIDAAQLLRRMVQHLPDLHLGSRALACIEASLNQIEAMAVAVVRRVGDTTS